MTKLGIMEAMRDAERNAKILLEQSLLNKPYLDNLAKHGKVRTIGTFPSVKTRAYILLELAGGKNE